MNRYIKPNLKLVIFKDDDVVMASFDNYGSWNDLWNEIFNNLGGN